jgi:hypothetical protein
MNDMQIRLKDCPTKKAFKMETLIIHIIFACKSVTKQAKDHPKT